MAQLLLIDTDVDRRSMLEAALQSACKATRAQVGLVQVQSAPALWRSANSYHVVVVHKSDIGFAGGLSLTDGSGPRIIKFGGGGVQDEAGECRSRVFAIYRAVAPLPEGPGPFAQPEVWKGILLFVLGASAEKPPELSERPVDPLILATWLLLKGYSLARGFVGSQGLERFAAEASRRWIGFSSSEKEGYWRPVAGGAVALADAKLSRASALVAEIQTKVEPERERALAAVKEVGEFLRRRGFSLP